MPNVLARIPTEQWTSNTGNANHNRSKYHNEKGWGKKGRYLDIGFSLRTVLHVCDMYLNPCVAVINRLTFELL